MARPAGSPNKQDSKPWRDALRVAAKDDPKRLRNLAEKTFAMAADGDMQAIKEIGDRLDGKAMQPTENKHEHEVGDKLAQVLKAIDGRTRGLPSD